MAFSEKRKHIRVKVNLPVEVVDILNDKLILAKMNDISAGGAGLIANERIDIGTPLSITFTIENINYKNTSCDVVMCKEKEEKYYIGVSFFNLDPAVVEQIDKLVRRIYSMMERGMQRGKIK
jgi:c-di-GMP-binding flagellar brake protein YcgR